ncbi:MAG: hemolysin family protein [Acidimicrobiaceae bacterium]|nr:hemolysin family protein [Acidimicrobiaceae bacterium]
MAALALMAANAFFVALEFALVAVDRTRVDERAGAGDRRARMVQRLVERLSFHLSGAQIGITVSSLLLGFMIEPALAPMIEPGLTAVFGSDLPWGVSVAVALILATSVQMVMGELVPKVVAITKPYGSSVALAAPASVYGVLARPLVAFLNGSANWMVRRMGMEPKEELDPVPDREELEHLFVSSGEEGTLDEGEVRLLTRSIRLADKQADDAMVPRVEVVAVEADASLSYLAALAVATGHSRFPVTAGHLDEVAGVVHVKSLFTVPVQQRAITPVSQLMQPVPAVPESRDLDDLLVDFRTGEGLLAVVVDEHGGTSGIITLEDVLEEIVGEIDDEHDTATPERTRSESRGSTVLPASLHTDEVLESCGFAMPEGDYETLAGLVLDRLGRIPVPGETVTVDGWRLEVVAVDGLRIATVRVVAPAGSP